MISSKPGVARDNPQPIPSFSFPTSEVPKEPGRELAMTSFKPLLSDSVPYVGSDVPERLGSKPEVTCYKSLSIDSYPTKVHSHNPLPIHYSVTYSTSEVLKEPSISYVGSEVPKYLQRKPGATSYLPASIYAAFHPTSEIPKESCKKPAVTSLNPLLSSPALYPGSKVLKVPDSKPAVTMNSPYQASMVSKVFADKPGLNTSGISCRPTEVIYQGSKMSKEGSKKVAETSFYQVIKSDESSSDEESDESLETGVEKSALSK